MKVSAGQLTLPKYKALSTHHVKLLAVIASNSSSILSSNVNRHHILVRVFRNKILMPIFGPRRDKGPSINYVTR